VQRQSTRSSRPALHRGWPVGRPCAERNCALANEPASTVHGLGIGAGYVPDTALAGALLASANGRLTLFRPLRRTPTNTNMSVSVWSPANISRLDSSSFSRTALPQEFAPADDGRIVRLQLHEKDHAFNARLRAADEDRQMPAPRALTILLVEDNYDNQSIYARDLRALRVRCALGRQRPYWCRNGQTSST